MQNQLAKEEKKKKSEPKIPNYLQKYYQNWVKYLHRYVPLYDKYVCTCCGKPKVQDEYFLVYAETDMGRIAPDGKMYSHICKDCCKKLYEYLYYEKANKDGEEAMKWLCSYLNIYFDDITYFKAKDAMEKNDKKNHIVEEYMNVVSRSATLKGKTFLESPNIGSVNSGSGGSSEKAEKIDGAELTLTNGEKTYKTTVFGSAYRFDAVANGEYKLTITLKSDEGALVPYTTTVEIEGGKGLDLANVVLVQKGDVNLDGTIDVYDLQRLYEHASQINLLTGYALAVSNINGSGNAETNMQALFEQLTKTSKEGIDSAKTG